MRKKNNIVIFLIMVIVIAFVIGVIWYKLENRQVYIPDIPNSHNLSSIAYELEDGLVTVAKVEDMDRILEGLFSLELSTKTVSVQDYPTDVDKLVTIHLYYKEEDVVGDFYIYKKRNKYYFEEPYNGIYKLTEEEYNFIIDLVEE